MGKNVEKTSKKTLLEVLFLVNIDKSISDEHWETIEKKYESGDVENKILNNILFHEMVNRNGSHLRSTLQNMYRDGNFTSYTTLKNYCKISSKREVEYHCKLLMLSSAILYMNTMTFMYNDMVTAELKENIQNIIQDKELETILFEYITKIAYGLTNRSNGQHLIEPISNKFLEETLVKWMQIHPYLIEFAYDKIQDPTTWCHVYYRGYEHNKKDGISAAHNMLKYPTLPSNLDFERYILKNSIHQPYLLSHSEEQLEKVVTLIFAKKSYRKEYLDELERLIDLTINKYQNIKYNDWSNNANHLSMITELESVSKHCNTVQFIKPRLKMLTMQDKVLCDYIESIDIKEDHRIMSLYKKLIDFCNHINTDSDSYSYKIYKY